MNIYGIDQEADIYLLGSGVLSFLDISLLTQKILREVKQVFHLVDLHSLERYLKTINPKTLNLTPIYYLEGRERRQIYQDIVQHVINAAAQEKPVALLLHGHPLVYSDISRLLLEQGRERGLCMAVVPGLSSLDRIYVDLELDIGRNGIQIFEASAVLLKSIPLNPMVDCLLLQIGALLSSISTKGRSMSAEEVKPLQDYLLKYYPADQPFKIVESSVEFGFPSKITEGVVAELERQAEACNYTATLFLPASGPPATNLSK